MITQAALNTSLTNLTTAVASATAAIKATGTNSTPDADVLSFQAGVDAQTVAINASLTPPPAP